jgi:predicted transcriptional regulator
MDSGPPAWFGAWMAFVVVAAIVTTVVRVKIARNLARKTGVDEDAATAAELFGTGAITSMYLNAHRTGEPAEADDAGQVAADLNPHLQRDIGQN